MSPLNVVKTTPSLTSATSATEAIARPKIMRRPSQFSSSSTVLIVQEPALNTPSLSSPPLTPPTKAWQDDGRFAIALILLVVAINLLVSTWLAPAAHPAQPIATTTSAANAAPTISILNELTESESNQ